MHINKELSGQVALSGGVTVSMRSYLSSHHLWAARHFAEQARVIEVANVGRSRFSIRHRAFVLGSVMEAVAFLDSAANEFFEDVVEDYNSSAPPVSLLAEDVQNALRRRWIKEKRGRYWSAAQKFHEALTICTGTSFELDQPPRSTVGLVIALRNRLMHFHPESADCHLPTNAPQDDELLAQLAKQGFAPNAFMRGAGNPFFPDHCLSAGCADWAVRAVTAYADEFFRRLGYAPNYQRASFDE